MSTASEAPPSACPDDVAAWAWAAGLFEGEGSLNARPNGRMKLTLAMTDRDVVERFRAIVGAGALRTTSSDGLKQQYRVDIDRAEDVLRILGQLEPYLGERRRARAAELRAALEDAIAEATRERPCAWCEKAFRPTFSPNAARRRYCSRRCMNAFHGAKRRTR